VLSILGVITILFVTNPTLAWVALIPLPLLALGAMGYTLRHINAIAGSVKRPAP